MTDSEQQGSFGASHSTEEETAHPRGQVASLCLPDSEPLTSIIKRRWGRKKGQVRAVSRVVYKITKGWRAGVTQLLLRLAHRLPGAVPSFTSVCLCRGRSVPQRTSGNAGRHFCCYPWGWGAAGHLVSRGQNAVHRTALP